VCTATLVGSRHILASSHCAFWHNYEDDSGPDPMIFQPGYSMGYMYPDAQVIHVYWTTKVENRPWMLGDSGGDWLVAVLD
jgi:V8-like Glu-specific endopeptidase